MLKITESFCFTLNDGEKVNAKIVLLTSIELEGTKEAIKKIISIAWNYEGFISSTDTDTNKTTLLFDDPSNLNVFVAIEALNLNFKEYVINKLGNENIEVINFITGYNFAPNIGCYIRENGVSYQKLKAAHVLDIYFLEETNDESKQVEEESTTEIRTSSEKELIPYGFNPKPGQPILLSRFELEYVQEQDCCSSSKNDVQTLKLSIEDGGGGSYYVMETSRWAFDNAEEIIKVLEDFKKRI